MPTFKEYNQNQPMLLPPDIREWIPKDHICFMINDVVESMNLSSIESTYSEEGCSAYDPRALIKIMFYAYSQSVRSSRKIEDMIKENLVCRYLTANQQPDHGTINLFRKNHLENLEDVFAQIVLLCHGLGMVDLLDLSIDSCVLRANASKKVMHTKEEVTKLKKKIQDILAQAETIDKEEDGVYGKDCGYNELPEKLIDPVLRQQEITKLSRKLKQMEEAEETITAKQAKVKTNKEKQLFKNSTHNTTDPDANLLKLKVGQAFKPAYRAQIATNNQVITAYEVESDIGDTDMLIPMINKAESISKQTVTKVKADSAFFSKKNMQQIEEKSIDAYIPDQMKAKEEAEERTGTIPIGDKRNFTYREKHDQYLCPHNQTLLFIGIQKGKRVYRGHCTKCQSRTGKPLSLNIDPELEYLRTTMRQKLNSKKGKAIYLERMSDVEPVFGNIIYNQQAGQFLCRGKPMVKREFGLSAIAHNLVKVSNWMKKNKKSIDNMQLDTLMRLSRAA